MGDCEVDQLSRHEALWFMNVHLEAPLLMHISVQPLLAVCSAVCGVALFPPGNEETNVGLLRDRRMVYALDHNPHIVHRSTSWPRPKPINNTRDTLLPVIGTMPHSHTISLINLEHSYICDYI